MDLYGKMPQSKGGTDVRNEILTSSAWNALIHHPAEDFDAEELPSTVDMGAIKGAPMTGQISNWNLADNNNKANAPASDESSSEDDDSDSDDNSNSRTSSESDSDVSLFIDINLH